MKTVEMIKELRCESEKHKNDTVFTGQTNISSLCTDVAGKLEENLNALIKVNEDIDNLIEDAHEISLKFSGESKAHLEGRVSAFWEVKNMIENLLANH